MLMNDDYGNRWLRDALGGVTDRNRWLPLRAPRPYPLD
jgi:hypothetical protein